MKLPVRARASWLILKFGSFRTRTNAIITEVDVALAKPRSVHYYLCVRICLAGIGGRKAACDPVNATEQSEIDLPLHFFFITLVADNHYRDPSNILFGKNEESV